MLKQDFRSDVGYWVHVCAHRFESVFNMELAEQGVSYRQCQVLAMLALEGDLSQAELARLSGVEPSTIVKVVDHMERDGLVVRQTCPGDRRKYLIAPTKAAKPLWARILKCIARVNRRATRGLAKDEVEMLRDILERVHTNLGSEDESGQSTS